jgi:hypothetical protein
MSEHRLRDLIEANLQRLIAALLVFIAAAVVALFVDVALPFMVVAAALALVALVAIVVWIADPWSRWREDARRRLLFVGFPLLGAATVLAIGFVTKQPVVVLDNPAYLIVLDRSGSMAEEFDDGATKLEAAQARLEKHLIDFGAFQLGLSAFGTEMCQGSQQLEEIVPLASDRAGEIREAAAQLAPDGFTNVVSAGIQALTRLTEFTGERRMLLIAGGLEDECGRDLRDLEDYAENFDIPVQWDLVGLGFSDEEKAAANALPDVNVALADTNEELDAALELLLFEQIIRDGLDQLQSFLDEAREPLNEAIDALRDGDTGVAELKVHEAREGVATGTARFDGISDDDRTTELEAVESKFEEQMERLAEAVPLLEDVVEIDVSAEAELSEDEVEARNAAVDKFNDAIGEYNSVTNEITDEVGRILTEMFETNTSSA